MFQGLGPPAQGLAEALGLSFGVTPYTRQWQEAESAFQGQKQQNLWEINLQQSMANQQASLQGGLLGQVVTVQEALTGQRINAAESLRNYQSLAELMSEEQRSGRMKPPKKEVNLFPRVVCQKPVPGGLVQVVKIPSSFSGGEDYEIRFQPDGPPEQKKPGWFSRWVDRTKPFLRPKFRIWPVIWVSAGLIGAGCVVLKSIFIIQENLTWRL